MTKELPEMDFQRFWRRLQQLGLNAYEARSYLVLVGHPRFKALELAARIGDLGVVLGADAHAGRDR